MFKNYIKRIVREVLNEDKNNIIDIVSAEVRAKNLAEFMKSLKDNSVLAPRVKSR